MKITITNTAGILYLVENAKGKNRSVYEEKFEASVDQDGTHVMGLSFLHNDIEMRTQWLCKMNESDTPEEIWLDVDIDKLRECTTEIEVPNEMG